MIRHSLGLAAVFGASFLVGTYANASLGRIGDEPSPARGDRLSAPAPAHGPRPVGTIEVIGVDGATLILRDRAGDVVFRHDGARNTTTVSRDVDLPTITVRERVDSPVQPAPVQRPAVQPRKTVGCEGAVSTLVKSEVARIASFCVT
jgi:hypothetical protein